MRIIVACILVLFLSSCVTQTAIMQGFQDRSSEVNFQLVDERNEIHPKTKYLSLMITSCNYSVLRVGEPDTVPNRLTILKNDLFAEAGDALSGKVVTAKNYTIHFNAANNFRKQTYNQTPGALSGAIVFAGSDCEKEKMQGGWYSGKEVTTRFSPIIIEISVEVDGKAYDVRQVYSPKKELQPNFSKPEPSAALFEAMRIAHKDLAAMIKEG